MIRRQGDKAQQAGVGGVEMAPNGLCMETAGLLVCVRQNDGYEPGRFWTLGFGMV